MKRWTPKLAVSRSQRSIAGAIERLRAVAHEWGDVDQAIVDQAEDLIRELETFSREIARDVAERMEAGEEIGI